VSVAIVENPVPGSTCTFIVEVCKTATAAWRLAITRVSFVELGVLLVLKANVLMYTLY